MIVARICKSPHFDLDGIGAKLYGGRWNSPGNPVVYTSSCGALAALEYRAHVKKTLPSDLMLLWIEIPDTLACEMVAYIPADPVLFPRLGDEWLKRGDKPLLRVPSVLVPNQWNLLINPAHPYAGTIKIKGQTPFGFDSRLLSTT
jgi:RES domain-containing protein